MVFDTVFWNALLHVLQEFTSWWIDQMDGGASVIISALIGLVRALPFITHTDLKLVNTLSELMGINQVLPLADAVLRLGLVLAVICNCGHQYWGWRALPDSLQRWGVALVLVRVSAQLLDWSLQVMDAMTGAVDSAIPDMVSISGVFPSIIIVFGLIYLWQLVQLVIVCAERLAWLTLLKPLGPLAFMFWVLPQTEWIAVFYVKLWTGWLVGQLFVIMAIAATVIFITHGGVEGFFLSIGCLIVARRAIVALVPAGGEGAGIKVGPVRL